jgi:hypothetical protein
MMLVVDNRSTRRKACPRAAVATINLTLACPGSKPVLSLYSISRLIRYIRFVRKMPPESCFLTLEGQIVKRIYQLSFLGCVLSLVGSYRAVNRAYEDLVRIS